MLTQRRFVIGAALIGAAVSYLVYAGIRTTSMYYFELGEFLAQRANQPGEQGVRRRANTPDGEMALYALRDALRLRPRLVDRLEDRHHPVEVGLAGRGQLDLPCAPDEEGDRQLALELADLL